MARSRLMDLMQGQDAPPGASPDAVGTDSIPTPELESTPPPPQGDAAPEGESESQNAIMQAMAAGRQLTPEEEELIRAKINLAARQRLVGGP